MTWIPPKRVKCNVRKTWAEMCHLEGIAAVQVYNAPPRAVLSWHLQGVCLLVDEQCWKWSCSSSCTEESPGTLPKVQRALLGHALLLTVRCQHKIPAVPTHRLEWLSLHLSLQTSIDPNSRTALVFLVLLPFALHSILLLSILGKTISARTSPALLSSSVVVLPFFTWDANTSQLKLKTQGYPEPSSSRPYSKLNNHVLKSGQDFLLLTWIVTPGASRSYVEVLGTDAMWIVMFTGHQHLEAWGVLHAKGVCTWLFFNKETKKSMLVFREAKQVMWGLQHASREISEQSFFNYFFL